MQIEVDERELSTIQGALAVYEGLLRTEESGKSLVDASGRLRDRWIIRAIVSKEAPLGFAPGVYISTASSLWEPLGSEEVHALSVRLNAVEDVP